MAMSANCRQGSDDRPAIAEARGEGPTGMEMMGAMRIQCDVAVLVSYLRPQRVDIYE